MKKIGLLLLLLVLITAGSCYWYFYHTDPNIIDEGYTQTEAYLSLQKQLEQERSKYIREGVMLDEVVRALMEQTDLSQLPGTLELDSLSFDTLTSDKYQIQIKGKSIAGGATFYRLGRLDINNVTTLLFIIKNSGVYPDLDVILTTVVADTVRDTEWIAGYRKNISEEVTAKLRMEENNTIAVTQLRLRQYPVQQHNEIAYRYRVAQDGTIEIKVTSSP